MGRSFFHDSAIATVVTMVIAFGATTILIALTASGNKPFGDVVAASPDLLVSMTGCQTIAGLIEHLADQGR